MGTREHRIFEPKVYRSLRWASVSVPLVLHHIGLSSSCTYTRPKVHIGRVKDEILHGAKELMVHLGDSFLILEGFSTGHTPIMVGLSPSQVEV